MSNTVLHLRILQMFKPLSQVFRKRTHSKRYDNEWGVFNSHEWGTSMATHSKALKIAQILEEQHNLKVWLDDHEIQGMVDVAMSRGIKGSKVFPILGTERWMKTINSGDRKDNSSRQVAVLGALDECGKSQQFLDEVVVQRWTQELPPWLCLVLSTRPEKEIPKSMRDFHPTKLEWSDVSFLEDLQKHLKLTLLYQPGLLDPRAADQIIDILTERSEGPFLWVDTLEKLRKTKGSMMI